MKTLATIIVLISFIHNSYAVDKGSFYKDAGSLSGYKLKTKLKEILKRAHRSQGYDALFNVYFTSDLDTTYENDGSIMDIYSEDPRSYDPYSFSTKRDKCGNYKREGDCFNREHLFPQSIFSKREPMKSDFFHVFPTDGRVNGRRGSFPFGEVNNASWTSANGSKKGRSSTPGYRDTVFEPIDEFKGDVARALLYFATRYEDRISSWSHAMLNGTEDQVYEAWFISLLVKWHKLDPVSAHEIKRNEAGSKFQGNRNPFIDHPEFVEKIWATIK